MLCTRSTRLQVYSMFGCVNQFRTSRGVYHVYLRRAAWIAYGGSRLVIVYLRVQALSIDTILFAPPEQFQASAYANSDRSKKPSPRHQTELKLLASC